MQEEVIYRCINPACARPMPRPVNYCPWCGTAQGQAAARAGADAEARMREQEREKEAALRVDAAAAAANAGAAAAAAMSGWSDAPLSPESPLPAAQPDKAAEPATGKAGAQGFRPVPSATDFGRSAAVNRNSAADHPAPPQDVPRPSIPARPARRRPVQLRWWILALALLWGVWLLAKPSSKKIERQIDTAIALARECKGNEAQAALVSLRDSSATPEQLARLEKSLGDQSAICTRRRLRNKAWQDASTAADAALDAGSADKARTRLQGFIRRWGEDDKTRALKARIDAAAAREQHPLAVPDQAAAYISRDDGKV